MPSLYAVMSGADDQDRPARERRIAANAAIAAAAVRFMEAVEADAPGTIALTQRKVGAQFPLDRSRADRAFLSLDAAIRAAGEAGNG